MLGVLGFFGIAILALIVIAISGLRIAAEYERSVVFRLGRYVGMRGPGLYWLIPLGIETQRKVDIRTNTVDVERQESITKDSVSVKINAVLWYKVTDPQSAIITVANYRAAVYQVALTTLRNIVGQHYLDEVLKERDKINEALQELVDKATDPWGIKVEMVEMKDVEIPEGMQRAMAQEAQASRERRARLIKADAEFESSIKLAEASRVMAQNPLSLELRRMQMITEVGAEQNTTTVIMMPSEFVSLAEHLAGAFKQSAPAAAPDVAPPAAPDVAPAAAPTVGEPPITPSA